MIELYFGMAALGLVALCLILVPYLRARSRHMQDTLTNTQIVRQRLEELTREHREGLLSKDDLAQAEKELKLALLDEQQETLKGSARAHLPVLLGAAFALIAGGAAYWHANQVSELDNWQRAMLRLPELGRRVVVEADQSIQPSDLEDFALGIRTKLIENDSDPTGWLLLGRLYASLNRLDSALQAYEKSLALNADNPGALTSYAQALLMTGQEDYLKQAIPVLQRLVALNSEDINALGMLAITASQLNNVDLALPAWQALQSKLPADDPLQAEVTKRIAQYEGEPTQDRSVLVNVELSSELQNKLPQNGYIFVFAQDAGGNNNMPAAVVRQSLGSLPLQVELSDANAMMPTFKLSQLNQARLVARISRDENVARSQGDLQGEIVIELPQEGQTKQTIIIDKEIL